jgi:hypothetical protein
MAAPDVFYVWNWKFKNPEDDDGPHVAISQLIETEKFEGKFLELFLLSHPHIEPDRASIQKFKFRYDAQQEADKRAAAAKQAEPERMLANETNPQFPNLILEKGRPAE